MPKPKVVISRRARLKAVEAISEPFDDLNDLVENILIAALSEDYRYVLDEYPTKTKLLN